MTQKRTEIVLTNPVLRLVIAIGLGVAAMLCLLKYEEHIFIENSGGQRLKVIVTRAELAVGDRITQENIGVQEIPRAYVHANALLSGEEHAFLGNKVFRKIPQNSFLQKSDFDDPNTDSSDAARTVAPERGMRAAAVPLGPMLSKTRMLRKGDLIDVIVHFQLGDQGSVATTLFQNVVVLEQEDGFALVSLSPEQAERLAFAVVHGTISVVLRNRSDLEKRPLPTISFQSFLKDYTGSLPAAPAPVAAPGKSSNAGLNQAEVRDALMKLTTVKGKRNNP